MNFVIADASTALYCTSGAASLHRQSLRECLPLVEFLARIDRMVLSNIAETRYIISQDHKELQRLLAYSILERVSNNCSGVFALQGQKKTVENATVNCDSQ